MINTISWQRIKVFCGVGLRYLSDNATNFPPPIFVATITATIGRGAPRSGGGRKNCKFAALAPAVKIESSMRAGRPYRARFDASLGLDLTLVSNSIFRRFRIWFDAGFEFDLTLVSNSIWHRFRTGFDIGFEFVLTSKSVRTCIKSVPFLSSYRS